MIYVIITIIIFLAMVLFPIVSSLFALRKRASHELIIPNLQVDDPKYFTDLYRSAFKVKLAEMGSDNVVKYTFKESDKIVEADKTIEYPVVCNNIIYAENYDFVPPEGITFKKEIFANKSVYLLGVKSIMGIYCKKNLLLGKGTDVVRWIDTDGEITIEDNCTLGLVTTSNTRIILGENCIFTKMLAPQIFLGFSKGSDFGTFTSSPKTAKDDISDKIVRHIKYIDNEMADENNKYNNTVISKFDISIADKVTVNGHIRSHKSIKVGAHAIVYGNIFAEENIYLGEGCKVLGNVFTQAAIHAEPNVSIGQNGKIKSIVAKEKIVFDKGCVVYGYIESENICEVCLRDEARIYENED